MSLVVTVIVFAAGLLAGFLVNVIATRLHSNSPILGRLHCSQSPHPLTPAQYIPVLGFVLQRGHCTTCGQRIPIAYPITELITGVVFVLLYLQTGEALRFALYALYAVLLILVLVIDWKHRDIYVSVIAVGSVLGLVGSALLPEVGIVSALAGAGIAVAFFALAYGLAKLIFPRIEEPLGSGDVLLALMMGLMLGFPNIVGALLVGPLLGGAGALLMLLSRRSKLGDFMPYGVALCAATLIFLIYPEPFARALQLPALQIVVSQLLNNP